MPIYEYICDDCTTAFDRLVSSSAADKAPCPKCGSKKTTRQFSTVNVGSSTPEPCKSCPSSGPPHACPAGGMCRQL